MRDTSVMCLPTLTLFVSVPGDMKPDIAILDKKLNDVLAKVDAICGYFGLGDVHGVEHGENIRESGSFPGTQVKVIGPRVYEGTPEVNSSSENFNVRIAGDVLENSSSALQEEMKSTPPYTIYTISSTPSTPPIAGHEATSFDLDVQPDTSGVDAPTSHVSRPGTPMICESDEDEGKARGRKRSDKKRRTSGRLAKADVLAQSIRGGLQGQKRKRKRK